MEPLYCETYLHAKPGKKRNLIRGLLIVLASFLIAFGLLASVFLGTFFVLGVMVLVAVVIILLMPTNKVAYEYIFVDGQIDFDQILKESKRKTLKRVDLEQAEVIAPYNSHDLDSYRQKPLFDYSSGYSDKNDYIGVFVGEKGVEQIRFTPDEKMLDVMGRKSPSKIRKK